MNHVPFGYLLARVIYPIQKPIPALNHPVQFQHLLRSAVRSKMAYKSEADVLELWYASKNAETNGDDTLFEEWLYPQLKDLAAPPLFITSPLETGEDAQAFIWKSGDDIFLAFRGTSSLHDVLTDVNVRTQTLHDGIKVHQGFYRQFKSLEPFITEFIQDAPQHTNMTICGHSLGSGLAQIASAFYGEMFPCKRVVCHTFGCPRTGNNKFVEWFATHVNEHVRMVNENDPVPMIPQRPIWEHTVNQCIIVDDQCNIRMDVKDIPWYKRIFSTILDIDFFAPIQDHDCDLYISRINTLYKNSQTPKLD